MQNDSATEPDGQAGRLGAPAASPPWTYAGGEMLGSVQAVTQLRLEAKVKVCRTPCGTPCRCGGGPRSELRGAGGDCAGREDGRDG